MLCLRLLRGSTCVSCSVHRMTAVTESTWEHQAASCKLQLPPQVAISVCGSMQHVATCLLFKWRKSFCISADCATDDICIILLSLYIYITIYKSLLCLYIRLYALYSLYTRIIVHISIYLFIIISFYFSIFTSLYFDKQTSLYSSQT